MDVTANSANLSRQREADEKELLVAQTVDDLFSAIFMKDKVHASEPGKPQI